MFIIKVLRGVQLLGSPVVAFCSLFLVQGSMIKQPTPPKKGIPCSKMAPWPPRLVLLLCSGAFIALAQTCGCLSFSLDEATRSPLGVVFSFGLYKTQEDIKTIIFMKVRRGVEANSGPHQSVVVANVPLVGLFFYIYSSLPAQGYPFTFFLFRV